MKWKRPRRMQWSRLKKMLEARLCDKLAGRVQIHMARYKSDEESGRMWLVLDKRQIFCAGDDLSPSRPEWFLDGGCAYFNAWWGRSQLEAHLLPSLSLSIEEALASPHEFTRALALLDKRVGKRRLQLMAATMQSEPLLFQHFYALRCQAEELR